MRLILFLSLFSIQFTLASQELAEGILYSSNLFSSDMKEGVSCYRIPALITAPNGDLVAAIDERVPSCGDLKWSRDINLVIRRSSDHGKTWSEIETIIDFPLGQSASDPSMILDRETGEIIMFYNFMDLDKEKDIYYLHLIRSKDNGKTWSNPEDITDQISKPEWKADFKFITSGRGIQTKDGTLLHCMVNLKNGMHVFGSEDHGKTWFLMDTPVVPANESKIVELNDGSWMINSRVNGQKLRYVHISKDKGKSWKSKPDESLTDPNCNASIIRYKYRDVNMLIFSNADSQDKRENLSVRYSLDEGVTWSRAKTIYPGGSAYSTLTVMEDGNIGLLFEKDDYKENMFVAFSAQWLLN